MPYLLDLAALAVSALQTASDAAVPALPMLMRPQFKIPSAPTLPSSKLAPSCVATIPVALKCTGIATGCAGIATWSATRVVPFVYQSVTGSPQTRRHVPTASYERGTSGPTLQLQTWDQRSHPPATNAGPAFPPPSYECGTTFPPLFPSTAPTNNSRRTPVPLV